MQLETSTSSLDTQMAKENAVNQVVTSSKSSLNQLGSWITKNSAKLSLVGILTFTNPNGISAQTPDVAKNNPKNNIENTIGTAKKDTNSVEKKAEPEWAKEYKKAALNSVDHMNKNFDQFNKESNGIDEKSNKLVNRFQYISKYSKKLSTLSGILTERVFTNEEVIIVVNIQKTLEGRSKEGLHPFLDKFAYLSLQEANALALSFKNDQIVKNQ